MSRDFFLYIEDIYESCLRILDYGGHKTLDLFQNDQLTYDAVMHNFMIIGEAIRHIPEELRTRFIDIDWQAIIGLRNLIVHEYFGIKKDKIWSIIRDDIPYLRDQMKEILDNEDQHPDLRGL